ncbi:MAG: hypothetical protein IJZ19_08950 [Lentisphaeria bacterium]|nr:hypothetical protein [Lentisphaeria bacterium]
MSEVLQKLFNFAMKLERENVLKATPYQRTEVRIPRELPRNLNNDAAAGNPDFRQQHKTAAGGNP